VFSRVFAIPEDVKMKTAQQIAATLPDPLKKLLEFGD
jgi:hypothetical protein